MANKTPLLPLYPSSEYMLVIAPDEHLQERIGRIKQAIAEKAGLRFTAKKTHILLGKWEAWDMQEEKILQRLHVLAMEQYPFKVSLENFKGFPSHTVYIPVTSREPILKLVGQVRQNKRLMQSSAGDPYFISEPYMPLAQGLTSAAYEQTMQLLGPRQFHAGFIADSMLLLKRRAGTQAWQILRRLSFEHLAVTATQRVLFA